MSCHVSFFLSFLFKIINRLFCFYSLATKKIALDCSVFSAHFLNGCRWSRDIRRVHTKIPIMLRWSLLDEEREKDERTNRKTFPLRRSHSILIGDDFSETREKEGEKMCSTNLSLLLYRTQLHKWFVSREKKPKRRRWSEENLLMSNHFFVIAWWRRNDRSMMQSNISTHPNPNSNTRPRIFRSVKKKFNQVVSKIDVLRKFIRLFRWSWSVIG